MRPNLYCVYTLARPDAKTGEVRAFTVIAGDWMRARELAAMSSGPEGPEVWLKDNGLEPGEPGYWATQFQYWVNAEDERERVVLRAVQW